MTMKPNDLLRRLRRLAAKNGWKIVVTEGGNHTKIRLNERVTAMPRHATDLPTGTFRAILKQLNLSPSDLE